MPKIKLKVNPLAIVEVENDDYSVMFEQLAAMQDMFREFQCGCCGCQQVRFVVRTDKEDNKYYELHCQNDGCRARLPFGVAKKNKGLYPKQRWDQLSPKEQEKRIVQQEKCTKFGWLPARGWYRWREVVGQTEDNK